MARPAICVDGTKIMRFAPFVFLGYCCGILAIVADMYIDQLRILNSMSTMPEVMVMRLPGFAAQSVLLAVIICSLLYLADRMGAVSSVRALSISSVCSGFLSWAPFHLQMSFIADEIKPSGFSLIFEFYGSIVMLTVFIAAVVWVIYASGGPEENGVLHTDDDRPVSLP